MPILSKRFSKNYVQKSTATTAQLFLHQRGRILHWPSLPVMSVTIQLSQHCNPKLQLSKNMYTPCNNQHTHRFLQHHRNSFPPTISISTSRRPILSVCPTNGSTTTTERSPQHCQHLLHSWIRTYQAKENVILLDSWWLLP